VYRLPWTEHRPLEERLKEYPELKAKIKAMLGIIEKAAEAERRIIEELR